MKLKLVLSFLLSLGFIPALARSIKIESLTSKSPFFKPSRMFEKSVNKLLKANWDKVKSKAKSKSLVRYKVLDDKSFQIMTAKSSGDINFDKACVQAVNKSMLDSLFAEIAILDVQCSK